MKFFLTLTAGFLLGAFLTIQYQNSVNRTMAQVNAKSNEMSQKVHDVNKALRQ